MRIHKKLITRVIAFVILQSILTIICSANDPAAAPPAGDGQAAGGGQAGAGGAAAAPPATNPLAAAIPANTTTVVYNLVTTFLNNATHLSAASGNGSILQTPAVQNMVNTVLTYIPSLAPNASAPAAAPPNNDAPAPNPAR